MARYDVVVIGAGLGGLTCGAILAREGRKVLVIERSNSVGGAASTYKSGDLIIEGSLHETSDPFDAHDPKHAALTRAGALDTVNWVPCGGFYEARGGPLGQPFTMPDSFDGARDALIARFPDAREGITQLLGEMQGIAAAMGTLSRGASAFKSPREAVGALLKLRPALRDWSLSLAQKLDALFGDNEAVKCAIAANLSYYHDDPGTLWWVFFAMGQGSYLQSGGRFIEGGSQRLSSALARNVRKAGGDVLIRRVVTQIATDAQGRVTGLTHSAKDGSDPQTVETAVVAGCAAPQALQAMLPDAAARQLAGDGEGRAPSISLFALTLGLARPPREFGLNVYSTQLLPPWMARLADYGQGTTLMRDEPGERMPPLSIVDYSAIASGMPAPPHVVSVVGPDHLDNWDSSDMDAYREKRGRWEKAIVTYLDTIYPGLASAVVASSFNSALSVTQYLNAPTGAVYGYAPTPPQAIWRTPNRTPKTSVPGLYLASVFAGFGGYNGAVQAGSACADMILRER